MEGSGLMIKQRVRELLLLLLTTPEISVKQLEKKLELTSSQLSYTIKKANEFLFEHNIASIKIGEGRILFADENKSELTKLLNFSKRRDYFSKKERVLIQLLMLFGRKEQEFIGIDYLAAILKVSRNTITRDLKETREMATIHHVTLSQNTNLGFYFTGEIKDLQKLLLETISIALNHYFSDVRELIGTLTEEAEVLYFQEKIKLLESELSVRLSAQKNSELLLLLIILSRSDTIYITPEQNLSDENLRKMNDFLLEELGEKFSRKENSSFISLFLLSSTLIKVDKENKDFKIDRLVVNFIQLMEFSGIYFDEGEQLKAFLYQHIFSMYYRLLFGFQAENPLKQYIIENYYGLHTIVSKNLNKIKELSPFEISEDEVAYLTALIAGNVRYMESKGEKLLGVVVCSYGMSVSQLLRLELKKHFPQISFLDGLSVSEIHKLDIPIEIIFSTVPLQGDVPVFIIDSNLEKIDFDQLTVAVGKAFPEHFGYKEEQLKELKDVVNRYAKVQSIEFLMAEFEKVLYRQNNHSLKLKHLSDFLSAHQVHFKKTVDSFDTILDILASGMLIEGSISPNYITALKKEGFHEHLIIKDGIALPHIKDDQHIYATSISLLKLEQPILLANEEISIFILLAADEKKEHLRAFEELFCILENEKLYDALLQISDYDSLNKVLKEVDVDE